MLHKLSNLSASHLVLVTVGLQPTDTPTHFDMLGGGSLKLVSKLGLVLFRVTLGFCTIIGSDCFSIGSVSTTAAPGFSTVRHCYISSGIFTAFSVSGIITMTGSLASKDLSGILISLSLNQYLFNLGNSPVFQDLLHSLLRW